MKVAYLFTTFPTLSQTFLQREVAGLAAAGVEVDVHSMWTPHPLPWAGAPGVTLHTWRPRHLFDRPFRSAAELAGHLSLLPRAAHVVRAYRPRSQEHLENAALAGAFALRHAEAFGRAGYDLIHGAWATAPATAALLLSKFSGIPFSFGAHAYDIHRDGGDPFLDYKLRHAALIHTTTEMNAAFLTARCPEAAERIALVRRGLVELPPLEPGRPLGQPLRLLSVGRLIPKKGQDRQIEAVALLKAGGLRCHLRIVGEGPLRADLERRIDAAGLREEIELCGAQPEEAVRGHYRWADLFWHSGRIDAAGDRDGLPNVLPEAMAQGVPVISSDAAGTTEAVRHQETGWIAPGGSPVALAEGVRRLTDDADLRERVRHGAHAWVRENFLVTENARRLAEAMRKAVSL